MHFFNINIGAQIASKVRDIEPINNSSKVNNSNYSQNRILVTDNYRTYASGKFKKSKKHYVYEHNCYSILSDNYHIIVHKLQLNLHFYFLILIKDHLIIFLLYLVIYFQLIFI